MLYETTLRGESDRCAAREAAHLNLSLPHARAFWLKRVQEDARLTGWSELPKVA